MLTSPNRKSNPKDIITVPKTLTEIFNDYHDAEVLEVVGSEDCKLPGLSSDGHKLRIIDNEFAS